MPPQVQEVLSAVLSGGSKLATQVAASLVAALFAPTILSHLVPWIDLTTPPPAVVVTLADHGDHPATTSLRPIAATLGEDKATDRNPPEAMAGAAPQRGAAIHAAVEVRACAPQCDVVRSTPSSLSQQAPRVYQPVVHLMASRLAEPVDMVAVMSPKPLADAPGRHELVGTAPSYPKIEDKVSMMRRAVAYLFQ
jgi:hypothetical protein